MSPITNKDFVIDPYLYKSSATSNIEDLDNKNIRDSLLSLWRKRIENEPKIFPSQLSEKDISTIKDAIEKLVYTPAIGVATVSNLSGQWQYIFSLQNLEDIFRLFNCSNPEKIKKILLSNDLIIHCLIETYNKIKEIFGVYAYDIIIDKVTDPEEDYEGLVIYIHTNLPPKKSIELLDLFDEEWWLDIDERVSDLVTVMVRSV